MDGAKVTHTTPINYGSFGPNQFTDILISNLIFNRIGDVFKESFTLNLSNILKLLLLMFINELRGSDFFKLLLEYVKKSPAILYGVVNSMIRLKTYKHHHTKEIQSCKQNLVQSISIKVDSNFLIALYNYICKNTDCKYHKNIYSIHLKNAKEHLFLEYISGIQIPLHNRTYIIRDNIQIQTNRYTQEIISAGVEKLNHLSNIDSYLDLLTLSQRDTIIKIKNLLIKYHGSRDNALQFLKGSYNYSDTDKYFSEDYIVKLLLTKYPKLDLIETKLDILILTGLIYEPGFMTIIKDSLVNTGYMLFDPYNKYENLYLEDLKVQAYAYEHQNKDMSLHSFLAKHGVNDVASIFYSFKERKRSELNIQDYQLHIYVESLEPIQGYISDFIKEIYKYNKKINDKVKIFYLILQTETKTTEVANPEYIQWEHKKELLEKIKIDPKVIAELTIPSKTIIKETMEKKISCKQLNEIEKDIDTLYLRKRDKDILVSCLSQFRDKKDVIKSLGLPNKLNILLYGLPGTGKSTTIQAVATFLNKDIYYVDLKDAETNADLQMMFEYVNKNVYNGGIIVLEDIDAMTNIVLKRNTPDSTPKSAFDQKSKLTLDYFLNVLQGTLTLDDSIFIVTTNHIEHLDHAFYRDGRFDIKIELKLCDRYQMNSIYHRILNRYIPEHLLKRIKEDAHSPASLIFHVKNYIFVPETPDDDILKPFLE